MNILKFEDAVVGMRVKANRQYDGNQEIIGETGTIICKNKVTFTVEFDKPLGGCHSARGYGKANRCWNYREVSFRCSNAPLLEVIDDAAVDLI